MEIIDTGVSQLLQRTTLTVPLEKFIHNVQAQYPSLGTVISCEPILEGYEDANFKLTTTQGIYVVKIFAKDRTRDNIQSYIKVLEEALHISVPVPRLVSGKQGNLSVFEDKEPIFYYLTDYFEGEKFEGHTPTLEDMKNVMVFLSKLNTLDFPVEGAYDSWGNRNVVAEYAKNKNLLTEEQNVRLVPIVEEMKTVDFSLCSKAVIHGDMQRKHVIKNDRGEYCILDFGCVSYDAKVIEVSVYLAWFCLAEDTWEQRDVITREVIDVYTKIHGLSDYELSLIPLLTQAAYAAYYVKTAALIQQGDTYKETEEWHQQSKRMLELCQTGKI